MKRLLITSLSAITLSWGVVTPIKGISEAIAYTPQPQREIQQNVNLGEIIAQTEVPLRIKYGGSERDGFVFLMLIVPDTDTTASAYGGRLRLYDVHIAKMFEVSNFLCQRLGNNTSFKGYEWFYRAGNGNINMGNFRITCRLAREITQSYGLGKLERTEIGRDTEGGPPESDVYSIPVLNITGNKVPRWINFVQRFQPVR